MDSNKLFAWLLSLFTLLHLPGIASTPTPRSSSQVAALLSTQDLKAEAPPAWRSSQTSNRKLMQSSSLGETLIGFVRAGDAPGVRRVLSEGADPNFVQGTTELTPIEAAIQQDSEEVLQILIDAGAVDTVGFIAETGALHLAAILGSVDVVQVLLNAGYQLDSLNSAGLSPLHMAAFRGFVNMGMLLLDNGATVDLPSGTGRTALIYAVAYNHLGMVRLLISRGADVNFAGGENERTPIFQAARIDSGILIQELIANGADINVRGSNGISPLMLSSIYGAQTAIELLVLSGVDKTAQNRGFTARESLCLCVSLPELEDDCNFDTCLRPDRMISLLE